MRAARGDARDLAGVLDAALGLDVTVARHDVDLGGERHPRRMGERRRLGADPGEPAQRADQLIVLIGRA